MEKRKLADDRPVCRNFVFLPIYIWGIQDRISEKGNLLCSQILSIGLLNIITYIQISLLDKKFHDPRILLAMTLVQLLAAIVWTYLFQRLYRLLFPPRRMLLVCGDRPAFHLMEKINSREDKYYLAKAIHIRVGMEAIIREAGTFDALIIGDIPAKERNALLKNALKRTSAPIQCRSCRIFCSGPRKNWIFSTVRFFCQEMRAFPGTAVCETGD